MIRGINRQMIIVKTDKSSIFETAYFLLRKDITEAHADERDILREANKIISENYSRRKRRSEEKKLRFRAGLPFFFAGSAVGILSIGLVWLFSNIQ